MFDVDSSDVMMMIMMMVMMMRVVMMMMMMMANLYMLSCQLLRMSLIGKRRCVWINSILLSMSLKRSKVTLNYSFPAVARLQIDDSQFTYVTYSETLGS
jgi:hypothetical protein